MTPVRGHLCGKPSRNYDYATNRRLRTGCQELQSSKSAANIPFSVTLKIINVLDLPGVPSAARQSVGKVVFSDRTRRKKAAGPFPPNLGHLKAGDRIGSGHSNSTAAPPVIGAGFGPKGAGAGSSPPSSPYPGRLCDGIPRRLCSSISSALSSEVGRGGPTRSFTGIACLAQ